MEEFLDDEDSASDSSVDESDDMSEFDGEAGMWEMESMEGDKDEEVVDFFDAEEEVREGDDLFRIDYSRQETRKDGEGVEVLSPSNKGRVPDLTLSVVTKPMDVFYSKRLVRTLSSFFKTAKQEPRCGHTSQKATLNTQNMRCYCHTRNRNTHARRVHHHSKVIQELEIAASNALQDLKAQTQAKLDYALQHHINMHLEFDIQTPSIYIKSNDSFLVLNLGQVLTCFSSCVFRVAHSIACIASHHMSLYAYHWIR